MSPVTDTVVVGTTVETVVVRPAVITVVTVVGAVVVGVLVSSGSTVSYRYTQWSITRYCMSCVTNWSRWRDR